MQLKTLDKNGRQNKKASIEGETKSERFKRLVESRTNSILEKIRVLANCADRRNYEYGEEEVDLVFSTIEKELKRIKMKFFVESKTNSKFGFPTN